MDLIPGRNIEKGQKVRVYVNLNKGGLFSVVDMKSGLVCGYTENCLLSEAVFFVSPSGRKKVLQDKRKLVHAWVRGIYEGSEIEHPIHMSEPVIYNPYLHDAFKDRNNETVLKASKAFLSNKKVFTPKENVL